MQRSRRTLRIVLPDLRNFAGTMGTPLLSGDAGVEQTINLIREIVDDAVKDPVVNSTAIEFVRSGGVTYAGSFSRDQKAQAIYNAVATRWTYVEDPVGPFGPKETLRPVRLLLQTFAGDCDDATILIAALCGTIGIPCRAVTIAADPSAPREFSHIYPEVEVAPGRWVAMDVARPGSSYASAPARYFRKRVWDLESKQYADLAGLRGTCGCGGKCCGAKPSRLNGYAVLGDDSTDSSTDSTTAEDIQAGGSLAAGIAQIVAASQGNVPVQYPVGSAPYRAFLPAGAVPPAGYPTATTTLTTSISPALILPALLILGLLAFAGRR